MFLSRRPPNVGLLVSGVIIVVWIFSMQWETVSSAENYSEREVSNRTKQISKAQSLIGSKSSENKAANRTITTKATKTTTKKPPTTGAFRFLDDYGALPGEPYDDDDDDDKTFGLLSTEVNTTTARIPIQKTEVVNAVLSRAQRSLEHKRSISESAKSKETVGSTVNAESINSTNRKNDAGNDIKPPRKRHIRDTDNRTEIINPTSIKLETKYAVNTTVATIPTSTTAKVDGTSKPNTPSIQDGQLPGTINNATVNNKNGLGIMSLELADAIGRPQQQSLDTSTEPDEGSGEVTEESTKITIRTTGITTAEEESTTTTKPTTTVTTTEKQESTTTTIPTTTITTTEKQESTTTTIPTTTITTTEKQESTTTAKPTTSVATTVTQELTTMTTPTTRDATTKTEEATTASTTTTSSTSTTTTRTTPRSTTSIAASTGRTTTPSPIEPTKPPKYDDVKGNVSMVFEITIRIVFDVKLENPESDLFKELSIEVEISVNKAFFNCPGFIKNSAKVKRFIQVSIVVPGRFSHDGPMPLADNEGPQTQADYDVLFESAKVVSDPVSVSNFIAETVAPTLEATGVGNYTVSTASMAQAANEQVANFTSDVCSVARCDPCYDCTQEAIDNSTANQARCTYGCNIKNQRCTIVNNTLSAAIGQCTCMTGYLTVGSGCTDQNVVIGVSVAVASAVFIGLLIAVMMLGYRAVIANRKLQNKYDSKSDESSIVSDAVERTENQDIANQSASNEQGYLDGQSITTREDEHRGGENDADAAADDDDDSNLSAALAESEVYNTFVPNLISVTSEDLSKRYSIARPRIGQRSLNNDMDIYQYASYF